MGMQARSDLDIIHKKEKQMFEQSVEETVKNLEKTHHKVSNVMVPHVSGDHRMRPHLIQSLLLFFPSAFFFCFSLC